MSFNFKMVARKNPLDPSAPEKYYASPVYSGEITMRQLSKRIAEISTVSTVDVVAVLEAFLQQIPKELAEGKIVRLGDFGSFRLTLGSEGLEDLDKFNSAHIKKLRPRFMAGKEFLNMTSDIKYVKEQTPQATKP
jgi:predicted histone-like DNA-binding protein